MIGLPGTIETGAASLKPSKLTSRMTIGYLTPSRSISASTRVLRRFGLCRLLKFWDIIISRGTPVRRLGSLGLHGRFKKSLCHVRLDLHAAKEYASLRGDLFTGLRAT